MEEIKLNKQQEKLFYEKLTEFEKDYIKSLYIAKENKNSNQSNILSEKLNEIQDLILELIKYQAEEKLSAMKPGEMSGPNNENFPEIKLKNLFKKVKKLSKEEGGFLYMPFRLIFYNFYLHYKKIQKIQEHKIFLQADNLIESVSKNKTQNTNYESLSTQASLNSENKHINDNSHKSNLVSSNDTKDEEAMCGLIHNDCYRSIINKFFEFYKFNEKEADPSQEAFIDKDNLIEIFKEEIIQYLNQNHTNNNKNISAKGFENGLDTKYKFKYYQGLNDLIIFFILLERTTQAHLENNSASADKNVLNDFNKTLNLNKKILSYLNNAKQQNSGTSSSMQFDLHSFLDFVFHRNFKPFCFQKLNHIQKNPFDNSKLLVDGCDSKQKQDESNALKMKKILPTVGKYIEIIDPKVKRRIFDLTKIDPFYSLGWILTWFTHNNENIFKNFRIIDYLLFSEINTIFYLVAVIIIEEYQKLETEFLTQFNFQANYNKKFYLLRSTYEKEKSKEEENFLFTKILNRFQRMKFAGKEFDVEAIIKETEKQRKLNKEKIKSYFEGEENRIRKYFINLRLNGNTLLSKFYRHYLDFYFSSDDTQDYIYFREKENKQKNVAKKYQSDKGGFMTTLASYPRIIISKFAKMSYGRKLFVFIMMSFISYLMVVISHLLRDKERQEL